MRRKRCNTIRFHSKHFVAKQNPFRLQKTRVVLEICRKMAFQNRCAKWWEIVKIGSIGSHLSILIHWPSSLMDQSINGMVIVSRDE